METLWLYGEDGTRHPAFVNQERIDSIPGLKSVMLDDGTPLNYVDDSTFKNPVTGELLSRKP